MICILQFCKDNYFLEVQKIMYFKRKVLYLCWKNILSEFVAVEVGTYVEGKVYGGDDA